MPEPHDSRDAAIQAARDRKKQEEQQRAAEQRARDETAVQLERNTTAWGSVSQTHSIARLILDVVTAFGSDVAGRGSNVLYRFPPQSARLSIHFELHHSGNLRTLERLHFRMSDAGMVIPETSISGLQQLSPVPVHQVTREWVEQIAESVWMRALEIHGN